MKASDFVLETFAFRTTLRFRKDRAWPSRIWAALAAAAGVKKAVEETVCGDAERHPPKLDGTFEIGANVVATKAPQGWNPQIVSLRFAAFDPKTGKAVGWGGPSWFGGRLADGKAVVLKPKFLRELVAEGKKLRGRTGEMKHDGDVWQLAFSPDGRRLVSIGADHVLRIWDVGTKTQIAGARLHKYAASFAVSADAIVVGGPTAVVFDWSGKPKAKLKATGALDEVGFFAGGKRVVAIGGYDGTHVHVFDALTGKMLADKDVGVVVDAVAVGPSDRIEVSAGRQLLRFDASLEPVGAKKKNAAGRNARREAISPDKKRRATAEGATIRIS